MEKKKIGEIERIQKEIEDIIDEFHEDFSISYETSLSLLKRIAEVFEKHRHDGI